MTRRRCPASGKRRFRDREEVVDALQKARATRARAAAEGGVTVRRERRAYACDACRGFHLTSRPDWTGQPPEDPGE